MNVNKLSQAGAAGGYITKTDNQVHVAPEGRFYE